MKPADVITWTEFLTALARHHVRRLRELEFEKDCDIDELAVVV